MAKKRKANSIGPSAAELRGVETFDTNDTLLLAQAPVEAAAAAFKAQKRLKTWRRDALGTTVRVADPSYYVVRLKGHEWTIITACVFSKASFLKVSDAKALSVKLNGKVIFFGNSDTASATEYELFNAGKSQERFFCYQALEFRSIIRQVDPPEDGPEIYTFVDAFIRSQDAFVPACSICFRAGWLEPGQAVTLAAEDDLPDQCVERMDYLG
jgi:hypothetical protein